MIQSHALPFIVIATLATACLPSNGDSSAIETTASTGAGSSTGNAGSTGDSTSAGNGGSTGSGGSAGNGGSMGNSSTGSSSSGSGGSIEIAPTVTSNLPLDGAIGVPTNGNVSATFSEPMDCSSLTSTTFTVTTGAPAIPILGTVICASSTAVFWPAAHLANNETFNATITTGAKSLGGSHLAAKYMWSFTTSALVAGGLPVNLGKAIDYAVLAKAAISTVPTSAITGNIGVSPAAATYITGFSLKADATKVFSMSTQVIGKVFAANYAVPTPANLTTAIGDMQLAFTDAASRAPDFTELGAGNVGGMTLAAGVYKWGTSLLIPTDVTLSGDANDVWIFQIAQKLTVSNATHVVLTGGALSKNVFWQVAGLVDIGTTSHLEGIVLTKTAITLGTGASVNGRLLAQTAVSIEDAVVVEPAP